MTADVTLDLPDPSPGWPWPVLPAAAPPVESLELARACARLFAGSDGQRLLAHLRRLTLGRALGPEAGDAALRHLEGQRALVLHLETLAARGRAAPA
ncbi:hypothetical protein [Rhodocista pekingensis]|uniref:Bbp19-like phage domain-containing protein n=1 Tax=Rhodocista pekingensis TaxID=201185 RepID=A0ABW2KZE7_9PROT